ncbi:ethanolaminephosphotransferase 1-like [Oppia nitens]|uniref:ethanolaminephosphotransferase 1-like n=1 Tax=Oppia nitens TaxID=1686743 RepID=UPI0023DA2843|nr:ethanolaminephosphotransferase 1-like [Oppia nitens]
MHPFWNLTVQIVPKWLAPNVLTFVGFLFTVGNGILLTIYDRDFYGSSDSVDKRLWPAVPAWVWLICAVNHFLAHTLDGIDGKQARRTGSSGPLGELMDHGMDSWTALFIPFCIYSIFGRSDYSECPLRMLFIFWTIFITFYLSHWEKYNTGILYLPWSYDVSQIALMIMYLATSFWSYKLWKFEMPFLEITSGRLFELISYAGCFIASAPVTIYNVYSCKTQKQPNFWESFRPLMPLLVLFSTTTAWAVFSPNNIIEIDPRCFYFMVGTVFSNIACRLIVSQMSSTRCEAINWFLMPLAAIVLVVTLLPISQSQELLLLRAMSLLFTLSHIHYAVCIVRQMCDHFRINCFSLKKRDSADDSEEAESLV